MYKNICQSCSQPLYDHSRGSESNGEMSRKYCRSCYVGGKFTNPKITLSEMEDQVAETLRKKHWPALVAKIASRQIVNLERWSNDARAIEDRSQAIYH
jgi:hypothetical protein